MTGLRARIVAGSSAAMPRRAWSSGPMRPWVTTSVEAGAGQQVTERVDEAPRIGPIRRAWACPAGARQRLVAADARDLLDDVRLDGEVAAMAGHDGHERVARPASTGSAALAAMTGTASPGPAGSVATSTRASRSRCSAAGMATPSRR